MVRLRLQRHGAKKRPFYRVVAADKRAPRDGRFIELLGTYDPLVEPPAVRLNKARVDYWLGGGAQPSETVNALIQKLESGNAIDLSAAGADHKAKKASAAAKKATIESMRAQTRKALEEAAKAAEAEAKAAAAAPPAEEAAPAEEAPAEAAEGAAESTEE